jgi:peptide/nickel transport system substrate-binding protein
VFAKKGERRKMKRLGSMAKALCISLLMLSLFSNVSAYPPIMQPNVLVSAVSESWAPATVDPAWCSDQGSRQLIFNVYETLIFYDGEHIDSYLPQIAAAWAIGNITGTTSPEGLPWCFRYTFAVRQNISFQDGLTMLTPQDVEYSIERAMVQDRNGGPTWMLYEPLLYAQGAVGLGNGNLTDPDNVRYVGKLIDHAVESNTTHVWFNLAFPGAYAPLLQILCQPPSSILSKQWVDGYVIGTLGRPDWNGDWGDYSGWADFHDPAVSPLDSPDPVMLGTGPYALATLDYSDSCWSVSRNVGYWRGWPADWPIVSGAGPTGYVDEFKVTWAYSWANRKVMFLAGEVDFCDVPRQYMGELHQNPDPPYSPPNYLLDGIREIAPLLSPAMDALFFTFDVDPATPYGPINDYGIYTGNAIPRDFFQNIHIRKAFAYAFDYGSFIQQAYLGEAIHPPTAIIPCFQYWDPTIAGYSYTLATAATEFQAVPDAWATGFNLVLVYNKGDQARRIACELIESGIESLNPNFSITLAEVDSLQYQNAMINHTFPAFISGWQADFPDAHDLARTFYHTNGTLAFAQFYSNPTMDALIRQGIETPDGPARAAIYHEIQDVAVNDCPSVPLSQAYGRHFERDWVTDWYLNIFYPTTATYQGIYAYPIWKQYYIPHSTYDSTPPQPLSSNLPSDITHDGAVNFLDLGAVLYSFGAFGGPPFDPRWSFKCDVNNDRKNDMKDPGIVVKHMGNGTAAPVHGGTVYLTAQPSKQNVSINYNVNVTVAISSVTGFTGYEIRILYDPGRLQFVTYNITNIAEWAVGFEFNYWMMIGSLNCTAVSAWMNPRSGGGDPFTGDSILVTFTFKGTVKGNATLDISTSTLGTGLPMKKTPYNPTSCQVRITMTGDINADGKVDIKDVAYVAKRFGTSPGSSLWDPNADINEDGKIDIKDVSAVARHYGEIDP